MTVQITKRAQSEGRWFHHLKSVVEFQDGQQCSNDAVKHDGRHYYSSGKRGLNSMTQNAGKSSPLIKLNRHKQARANQRQSQDAGRVGNRQADNPGKKAKGTSQKWVAVKNRYACWNATAWKHNRQSGREGMEIGLYIYWDLIRGLVTGK